MTILKHNLNKKKKKDFNIKYFIENERKSQFH